MNFTTHIISSSAVAACFCWLVLGCDNAVDSDDTDETAEVEIAAEQLDPDVAAVVNGRKITRAEVDRHLDRLGELYRRSNRSFDESTRTAKQQRVLQRLIDRELLRAHASRQQLDVDTDEVDEALHRRIDRKFGSSSAFQRFLDSRDMTVAGYRTKLRDDLALEKLIDQRIDTDNIDEQRLRRYYNRIANRRPADDRIEASKLDIELTQLDDDQTHRLVRDDLRDASKQPVDLETITDRVDDWPDEFGVETRTRLHPPRWYEERHLGPVASGVLFEDEKSDRLPQSPLIVDTTRGFEVYQVHDRRDAGIRQFDEVEDLVRDRARRSELERQRKQLIEELRDEATISINIDGIERFHETLHRQEP